MRRVLLVSSLDRCRSTIDVVAVDAEPASDTRTSGERTPLHPEALVTSHPAAVTA
jgi:hypothetical protein